MIAVSWSLRWWNSCKIWWHCDIEAAKWRGSKWYVDFLCFLFSDVFLDSGIAHAHVCFHMHHELQSTFYIRIWGYWMVFCCLLSQRSHTLMIFEVATLPHNPNIALETQWLEHDIFFWDGRSLGATLVFRGVLMGAQAVEMKTPLRQCCRESFSLATKKTKCIYSYLEWLLEPKLTHFPEDLTCKKRSPPMVTGPSKAAIHTGLEISLLHVCSFACNDLFWGHIDGIALGTWRFLRIFWK